MLVVQRIPATFRRPVAVLQVCTLLFFTDPVDDWKHHSVPRRYFCPELTTLFIVSRMGKGKKRHVMFWNRIIANKLRRIDFFFVYRKRYAWKKSVRLFVLGNVVSSFGKEISKTSEMITLFRWALTGQPGRVPVWRHRATRTEWACAVRKWEAGCPSTQLRVSKPQANESMK